MKPKRQKNSSEIAATTGGYGDLLAGIKQRIATAQVRAHLAVSRELNLLYWQIGQDIVVRQKLEGWGKSVIETLSADLQAAFPGIEGFSANNVWRMRAFYLAYEAEGPILAQPAQEIRAGQPSPILAQLATELPPPEILSIPWFHNVIIIQKIKEPATRLWYAAIRRGNRRLSLVRSAVGGQSGACLPHSPQPQGCQPGHASPTRPIPPARAWPRGNHRLSRNCPCLIHHHGGRIRRGCAGMVRHD